MKKLVLKKDLELGFGKTARKGGESELLDVSKEQILTNIEGHIKSSINKRFQILINGMGIGMFSENEFYEYFNEVKEEKNKISTVHISGLSEKVKLIRNNRVTIVILSDGTKGISKCLAEDVYDEKIGFEIAYKKALIKQLNKNLKEYM